MANKKGSGGKRLTLSLNRATSTAAANRRSSNTAGDDDKVNRKSIPAVPQSTSTGSQQGPNEQPKTPPTGKSTDNTHQSPVGSVPHHLREGAARGTRSARRQEIVSAFKWEALEIEKSKVEVANTDTSTPTKTRNKSKGSTGSTTIKTCLLESKSTTTVTMSRNRPRGPPVLRDNGLAATEETDMWNKILQDLRKAKEKNDKQKMLAEQIVALNEKIAREGNRPTLAEYSQLDNIYRQMAKLCEEERAILQDEPSDVIKNLGLLTALRQASEAEAPLNRIASLQKSRKKRNEADGSATDSALPPGLPVSDKLSRVKGGIQRSTSVPSQTRDGRDGRDGIAVKIEEGAESPKSTLAERTGQLVIGAEVVFKHNKNKQGIEGEGIQCIIKGISGEGFKRRYDVQDPEPNENGEQGAVYRTTAASLIPIPRVGSALPSFPAGKQVLARYPDTTTFYRAEVMGSRKDFYRLKFEGEEDDKEMEVDKRFVLDIPGK